MVFEISFTAKFAPSIQNLSKVCCVCSATKSCQILCNPVDCSPPGSTAHGISQVRTVVWVAMLSSRGYSWPRNRTHISYVSCIKGGFFTTGPPERPYTLQLVISLVSLSLEKSPPFGFSMTLNILKNPSQLSCRFFWILNLPNCYLMFRFRLNIPERILHRGYWVPLSAQDKKAVYCLVIGDVKF